MKKIINKTSTPIYDFLALLSIIFSQILVIIAFYLYMLVFFYAVEPTLSDKIINYIMFLILIIFLYILNKRLVVALKYFFALEECFCENGIFYYKKILFKKLKIKELSIPVIEILDIYDLGKRIIEPEKSNYLNYFKPNERIGIKTISGTQYRIWNYVRRATLFHIDNRDDKDVDFFISLKKIKEMIELEKIEQLNSSKN